MQQLEQRQPEDVERPPGPAVERAVRRTPAIDVIERRLPAQRAGGDLAGERAVALVARGAARARASAAGRSARPLLTARSTSYAARRAGAITAASTARPAAIGRPARNSRAVMTRLSFGLDLAGSAARSPSPAATVSRSPRGLERWCPPAAAARLARHASVRWIRYRDAADPDAPTTSGHGCRPRTRLWMRAAGSDQSIASSPLGQLRRVGRARVVLRRLRSRAPAASCSTTSSSSDRAELARARARPRRWSRPAPIGLPDGREHRPGVELAHHPHDGDAGLGVARRSPRDAPARRRGRRQQRRVDVDHAEPRDRAAARPAGSGRTPPPRRGRRRSSATAAENASSRRRAGCSTGMPRAIAHAALVGVGCSCWPRPLGRSGCDTTRDDRRAASRAALAASGTANAGVPKNDDPQRRGVTICRSAAASGSSGRSRRA